MSRWSHYSIPDDEYLRERAQVPPLLAAMKKGAVQGVDEIIRRQTVVAEMARKLVATLGPPEGIIVDEKRVPVTKPPGDIAIRTYTPGSEDVKETFPVYTHFHGGGYCMGTLDQSEVHCRTLCAKHRIVIVNVDYRLAPQFPWPTCHEDAFDVLKWVLSNTSDLRVDLKKGFIVEGLSAGANITCVAAQRARHDPELKGKFTGQILQVPATISHVADYPDKFKGKILSYEQHTDDPLPAIEDRSMYLDAYKPGDPFDPRVSPLLAESLAGLPPAFVQIAGADPLRDEGLLYAEQMKESGVPTKVEVYPGVPHGFANLFPKLAASVKYRADLDAGIQWLLGLVNH